MSNNDNSIFWLIKSKDNTYIGKVDDGSWIDIKKIIKENHESISFVQVYSKYGEGNIDPNKKGYFLCNKSLTELGLNKTVDLVGLGYLDDDIKTIRVKWFSKPTLELVLTEARPLETSELFTIINPFEKNSHEPV
jgi:hypothetical protein